MWEIVIKVTNHTVKLIVFIFSKVVVNILLRSNLSNMLYSSIILVYGLSIWISLISNVRKSCNGRMLLVVREIFYDR
jgi:hypothetical protein